LEFKGGTGPVSYLQDKVGANYGDFSQHFMEYVQDCFAPMYKRVYQKCWNNNVWSFIKRSYYICKHDLGLAEYYIPTCVNQDGLMQYHRVVVSVLPELDQEVFDAEVRRMLKPFILPAGKIDSCTVFVVAPRTTKTQKMKVKQFGRKAMVKISRIPKGLAMPIIVKEPEIAFKKLLTRLTHFWNVRVKRLLEKLEVQPMQYDYNLGNIIKDSITVIENKVYGVVKQNLKSMISTFLWLGDKLKLALKRIGNLNILKSKVLAGLSEVDITAIPNRFVYELKIALETIIEKAQSTRFADAKMKRS